MDLPLYVYENGQRPKRKVARKSFFYDLAELLQAAKPSTNTTSPAGTPQPSAQNGTLGSPGNFTVFFV